MLLLEHKDFNLDFFSPFPTLLWIIIIISGKWDDKVWSCDDFDGDDWIVWGNEEELRTAGALSLTPMKLKTISVWNAWLWSFIRKLIVEHHSSFLRGMGSEEWGIMHSIPVKPHVVNVMTYFGAKRRRQKYCLFISTHKKQQIFWCKYSSDMR